MNDVNKIKEYLQNIMHDIPGVSLMTHIVGGFPDLETSTKLLEIMSGVGVEYTEIQIPFSDPIADGPTILNANTRALSNGTTPSDCFELAQNFKGKQKLLFMTYYNIVLSIGVEKFFADSQKAGIYGVIIPDMPYDMDSHEHLYASAEKNNVQVLPVISPITPDERLQALATKKPEIVYCVSQFGTTGKHAEFKELKQYLERVKANFGSNPKLAVGFGIQSSDDVKKVINSGADTAVIGSALLNLI
ncbi:tryptophan synthase subunit alpha [Candidatus Saccharibacteria bacterium]|jgi:tryptophan synthase alpha chain|nr:tryptophan synthase subunit alpha [Candidatus Saccharibacteria bacterium]